MTEENYWYRTSPYFLRGDYRGPGRWEMPVIPRTDFTEEELQDLKFIPFDQAERQGKRHLDRMVHFYQYDYRFERVWTEPERDLEVLGRYRAVLSPDFSMYLEMHPVMKLYNTFRSRWCQGDRSGIHIVCKSALSGNAASNCSFIRQYKLCILLAFPNIS